MANGAEVARAYVTIVPTMQGAQAEITKELTGVTDAAAKSAGDSGGSNFGSSFASAIKGTATVITGALVAATTAAVGAATAAGKAFIDAAKDTAAYGDTVDKASQRLGISRQSFQELDYVLNLCGTSMDSMSAGFKTLNNKIADARSGSEDAMNMFTSLGISMEDVANLSTEDLFTAVINGLQDMEEGADRAALANDFFGRSGQTLAPLLNMTSEEMQGAIDTANEYGMILSDEGVSASADFTDSLTTMNKTVKGLKNTMMANFLPAMSGIMDGISQIFSGDRAGAVLIKDGITDLIGKVATYAPLFFDLTETIVSALFDGFAPMLPQAVESVFSFLNMAITQITLMIPQLTPVIQQGIRGVMTAVFNSLPIIINALLELTTELVTWLASDRNVYSLVSGIMQLVSILADSLSDVLPVLLPAIINIIGQVAEAISEPANVEMILNSVLLIIGAVVMALVESLPEIGYLVTETFLNLVDLMADFWEWIVPIVTDGIEWVVNKVTGWTNSIKSALTSFANNVKSRIVSWITNIKNTITNWITTIKTGVLNFFENLKSGIQNAFNFIGNSISNVKTKVGTLVSGIISTIAQLPSRVISIGRDLIAGLWNGINDKVSWLTERIRSMGNNITKAIKRVLGIASPSKVWKKEIGVNLALGLGAGYIEGMEDVKEDMTESMDDLTVSMNNDIKAYSPDTATVSENNSIYNGGNVTINVYGAEGQDINDLARTIAQKLEDMTRRKELAYA